MPVLIYVPSTDPIYRHLPRTAEWPTVEEVGRHALRYYWPEEVVAATRAAHPPRPLPISPPAQFVDLLAAIFGVNRAAKRYRDAALSYYRRGLHGFATSRRENKEHLYELKNRGVLVATRDGRLAAIGTHGVLTLYQGEGYTFHSLLRPLNVELPALEFDANEAGCLYVEQKPKTEREPRLKDSLATLEALKDPGREGFVRLSFPPRRRREEENYEL